MSKKSIGYYCLVTALHMSCSSSSAQWQKLNPKVSFDNNYFSTLEPLPDREKNFTLTAFENHIYIFFSGGGIVNSNETIFDVFFNHCE